MEGSALNTVGLERIAAQAFPLWRFVCCAGALVLLCFCALAQGNAEQARLQLRVSDASVEVIGLAMTGLVTEWPGYSTSLAGNRIELLSGGDVVAAVPLRVPNKLYHCVPDPVTGALTSGSAPIGPYEFSVRVPFDETITAVRHVGPLGFQSTYDAKGLPKSTIKGTWPVTKIVDNGPDDKRLVFAIVGDGYRAHEIPQFATDARNVVDGFFSLSPWNEYAGLINVYRVDVVSQDSGADHPADGVFVDTALDASYGEPPLQRLLTVSNSKAFSAANSAPSYDFAIAIVNDTEYGGSGGAVATMSVHNDAIDIGIHEMGHTFAALADEYETSCPGCPTFPFEPNVTSETTLGAIEWSAWIENDTPLPTPELGGYAGVVGLFEGAKYVSVGNYRPRLNCMMRTLGVPFCEVCAETHIVEILKTPGVSLIEHAAPNPAEEVDYATESAIVFGVTTAMFATHAPVISWRVDGALQPGETDGLFVLDTTGLAGTHTVTARVEDPTPLVRNDPMGHLDDAVTWTLVDGTGTGSPPTEIELSYPVFYEEGTRLELALPDSLDNISAIQWFKGSSPLADGGRIAGTQSKKLVIEPLQLSDTGKYSVTFEQPAKITVMSTPIQVEVYPVGALPALGAVALGILAGAILGAAAWGLRRAARTRPPKSS